MDDVFSALADPIRRQLLERLAADNGQTLRELSEGIAITRQGMAKHLAALEAAGLVIVKRAGREKLHFIRRAPLELADGWLAVFRESPAAVKQQVAPSPPPTPRPPPPRRKRIDTRPNHAKKSQHDPWLTERRVAEQMERIKGGRASGPGRGAT